MKILADKQDTDKKEFKLSEQEMKLFVKEFLEDINRVEDFFQSKIVHLETEFLHMKK
eukprot:CAMPEP_0170565398 /NCGR_PEP_ID=MMETSP0211-20121228/78755_1 /TAXON_ID=311385 /ORGANISM="Pseudokeronopsis sp., Strain OXSARD2" /LENGTH=56 /DNA_ID=CAMNT_0010886199 /DNA_START=310 /DNA_END=480 /DNA_ORIENTATION=+